MQFLDLNRDHYPMLSNRNMNVTRSVNVSISLFNQVIVFNELLVVVKILILTSVVASSLINYCWTYCISHNPPT